MKHKFGLLPKVLLAIALGIVFGLFVPEWFTRIALTFNANGGVITLQDLRDLAVSAKTDCYHVVDAADDAALGLFYAENDFIPELDGVSDAVFKMLDFAGIGRMMRCSENGNHDTGYQCYTPVAQEEEDNDNNENECYI